MLFWLKQFLMERPGTQTKTGLILDFCSQRSSTLDFLMRVHKHPRVMALGFHSDTTLYFSIALPTKARHFEAWSHDVDVARRENHCRQREPWAFTHQPDRSCSWLSLLFASGFGKKKLTASKFVLIFDQPLFAALRVYIRLGESLLEKAYEDFSAREGWQSFALLRHCLLHKITRRKQRT